jgi:hypothetical protein
MHPNAEFTSAQREADVLLSNLLLMGSQTRGTTASSRDDVIQRRCQELSEQVPALWDLDSISQLFPSSYQEALNTVVIQVIVYLSNLCVYTWSKSFAVASCCCLLFAGNRPISKNVWYHAKILGKIAKLLVWRFLVDF